ncbi:MAG: phosphoribosylaminoimidazolesuccinocarboxamide synthase [Ilumatobacter sp.]|nr:MAG: phosphoribosylaminoimidazolesuccinocarboxamide synthase [Ilumatobacter sp.]
MRRSELEPFVDIDLPLPDRRDGKVRVSYGLGPDADGVDRRLLVTTDRLSAFDRVIAGVPYKGQVLNELAAWWFGEIAPLLARHGARHHVIDVPDPNVLVARSATPLPVEVVVRGHITGVTDTSLWRRYSEGQRTIDGHRFPDGLRKNTPLPRPIITPTTKGPATSGEGAGAAGGHDEPLSCAEVVERGLVDPDLWEQVQTIALAVFDHGMTVGAAAGLLLADTKYEFGVADNGTLLLIDEVHTPDSSRWWVASTYEARVAAGDEPESLDKEVVRRAFADLGYRGDGPVPELPDEIWTATSARYIDAYQRLVGRRFEPGTYPVGERIVHHLTTAGLL